MKYIVIVASLLMVALMFSLTTQAGTFKDDFNDGNFDGWETIDFCGGSSSWKVENGMVVGKYPALGNQCGASLLFSENDWRNYSIEFDAKMVEILSGWEAAIGIVIHINGINGIWTYASPVTAAIESWNNFQILKSAVKAFDLQKNQWYRLKWVVGEDSIKLYIGGKLMASLSGLLLPIGRFGFYVRACEALYDNVVITWDDVKGNYFAVSRQDKLSSTWGSIKAIK